MRTDFTAETGFHEKNSIRGDYRIPSEKPGFRENMVFHGVANNQIGYVIIQ
jgi:hypothetical protein